MARLEIACFNTESALLAAEAGADRIELCKDRGSGGTTPDLQGLVEIKCRLKSPTPVMVMIRPRGGHFIYSEQEFEMMKAALVQFKDLGLAAGFVFGILDAESRVDVVRNSGLVRLASPLPCTFHRAFDRVPDMKEALEDVVGCGFTAVLTSGGKGGAVEGRAQLKQLVDAARGRLEIMPAGSVRAGGLGALRRATGAEWFHSSAIEGDGEVTSRDEVLRLREALK